ncbi:MAG: ribonuclease HI family protein [Candidatus Andersenbacteria bacterium]
MRATLHSDGGARGNPGPAGIGFVLHIMGGKTIQGSDYIGEATNNHAEYVALLKGLHKARALAVTEVTCYLDSELVVKQLRGEYRVKHQDLRPLYEQVQQVASAFARISFQHVLREKNKAADKLVNEAIDRALHQR